MKLSVVTPSFQQGRWIAETLASVRRAAEVLEKSGLGSVEHWVMDGGSTDETLTLLKDQTFARWISEPDQGQTDAVNKGWARCTGEILCFLCSDDLWHPNTALRVVQGFLDHPDADLVYGDYHFLEGSTGWLRPKLAGPFSVERLRRRNFLSQPATFLHRRVLDRFGPLDVSLRYCMDHEYWLRICADTRWIYLPGPLAVMRLHQDAKTSSALGTAWTEAAAMQERYGITGHPTLEALWMRTLGGPYYRGKRRFFHWLGERRKSSKQSSL